MKEGWKYMKLGEIATIRRGLTYKKEDEVEKSNKIVLRSNNVDLETHQLIFDEIKYLKDDFDIPEEKILKKGDLLMCMSNGSKIHLGKVALIEQNTHFAFGGFMSAIEHNKSVLDKFFYYALISPNFKQHIKELQDGANINNLKIRDIESFSIPVPSLSDQQRIVSYLDAEFAKIEALKANAEKQLQAAKDLFQAALKELLTPKEGWVEKKLGELCDKTKNIKWTENSGTHQYIDLSSVSRDSLAITDSIIINYKNAPSRAKQIIKTHDILFATTRPTLRRLCIVNNNYDNEICSTGFCVLRPNSTIFYGYLFFSLLTDDFYKYIEPLQTGANYPAVTDGIVKQYVLFIPPSLSEQQRIADRLDALSANVKALQTNYTETITLCNDLKQALLKKVFEEDG